MISVLMSSYNRTKLLKRTLYNLATHSPKEPWELVVVDEGSTEDTFGVVNSFSSAIPFKFISVKTSKIEEKLGLKKYHNNPAVTNNIAFEHSCGDKIFLMGNEIIIRPDTISQMMADIPKCDNYLVLPHTCDMPQQILDIISEYGDGITENMVNYCKKWPLQSFEYRSNVTNYFSLCSRNSWVAIDGYDERYWQGIACEDSDFYRRILKLPDSQVVISKAITLHAFHGGMSKYYQPVDIKAVFWDNGLKTNRALFHNWDETHYNRQGWKSGQFEVESIKTNIK